MKPLLTTALLLMAVGAITSCGKSNLPIRELPDASYGGNVEVVIIDSCEYIFVPVGKLHGVATKATANSV